MGFSLVAKGLFHAYLPNAPWRPLLENFGYSVGFLIVVLGRQQLFTENTLTVILPLLAQPSMRTFLHVLRLWGVVFATNMLGTFLFATIVAHVAVFPPEIQLSFLHLSQQSVSGEFGLTLVKGIFSLFQKPVHLMSLRFLICWTTLSYYSLFRLSVPLARTRRMIC